MTPKSKYKNESDKKDKTISFRISNRIYDLLERLSEVILPDKSINIYARTEITRHVYSQYPAKEDLKDLYDEKSDLMKKSNIISSEIYELQIDLGKYSALIGKLERKIRIQYIRKKTIEDRAKFIDDKIKKIENRGIKWILKLRIKFKNLHLNRSRNCKWTKLCGL